MAQSSKISGIVVSSEDNEPIVGASIMVEGTKTGTITDIDGRFTLNVAEGVKLQISYIGMKTTVVKAKKKYGSQDGVRFGSAGRSGRYRYAAGGQAFV